MMFMRTLLYKGGRLVSHFLPVDDIDASSYGGHALALQVVNQLVVGRSQRLQFRDVGNHFLEDAEGLLGHRR